MTSYRMRTIDDGLGKRMRVRVVRHRGFLGYVTRWTQACSGCTIDGSDRGMGCHECGHTGRRRNEFFVPFNMRGFQAKLDAQWQSAHARGEVM